MAVIGVQGGPALTAVMAWHLKQRCLLLLYKMRELHRMAAGERDRYSAEQRLLVPSARRFNGEQASWISGDEVVSRP